MGLPKPPPAKRLLTDSEGRFVFHGLGSGIYTFNTSAPGYLDGAYGQRRPSGPAQPFVLAEGQRVGNVTVRLWRYAAIGGTVRDEAGEPAVGQAVRILRREPTSGRLRIAGTAQTDDRGVYRLGNLLPGDYLVAVPSTFNSMPLSAVSAYYAGQAGARGNATANPVLQSLTATRSPSATAAGIHVGDAVLQISSSAAMAMPPVVDADGRVHAYPMTFHPGAPTSAAAATIVLAAGEDRSGADIQMQRTTLVQVSGTLTGPDGPEPHFGVRLIPAGLDIGTCAFYAAATATDGNGMFTFAGVAPGAYVLRAAKLPRTAGPPVNIVTFSNGAGGVGVTSVVSTNPPSQAAPLPTDPTLWAEMPVSVGSDAVTGIAVQLQAAPTMSGRLIFEGAAPQPAAETLRAMAITLMPASGDPQALCCPASRVAPDGHFNTQGYPPDRYFPNAANIPPGWHLKNVSAHDQDILQTGLAVGAEPITDLVFTFTDATSEISGIASDQTGKASSTASVVLFPASVRDGGADAVNPRLVRLARPSPQTGAYKFLNVIPGSYLIAAAEDDLLSTWPDPALMTALSGTAARVTIAPGEKHTQDLTTRKP
jgi:hypothetical protein